jgi:hypothetical protein
MICFNEENVLSAILATYVYLLICKLIATIYKTDYAGFVVLAAYIIKLLHTNPDEYRPIVDVLNCLFNIWVVCLIDKIANSRVSHGFFVLIFVYMITVI